MPGVSEEEYRGQHGGSQMSESQSCGERSPDTLVGVLRQRNSAMGKENGDL